MIGTVSRLQTHLRQKIIIWSVLSHMCFQVNDANNKPLNSNRNQWTNTRRIAQSLAVRREDMSSLGNVNIRTDDAAGRWLRTDLVKEICYLAQRSAPKHEDTAGLRVVNIKTGDGNRTMMKWFSAGRVLFQLFSRTSRVTTQIRQK